jgi:hypothetical protein
MTTVMFQHRTEDDRGNRTYGTPFSVDAITWWPDYATEETGLRGTTVTGYRMALKPGQDVQSTDRANLPGDPVPWHVHGEVAPHPPSPFTGWQPGVVVSLRRAQG